MDDRRFDDLAKAAAAGSSRRGLLKGLAGGGLAALLAAFGVGVEEAAAGRCERRCRRRFDRGTRARRRCVRACRRGGGGGGGGTTGTPQPVSTNASPDAALVGESCAVANDCQATLTCNNSVCTACTSTCEGGTQCCTAGVCDVVGEQDVCVLS